MSLTRRILLAATTMLALTLCAGCAADKGDYEEPVTLSLWHVYGGQTDSP